MEEYNKTASTRFFDEWKRSSECTAEEASKALERLAESVDAVKLFVVVMANLIFHPADQYSDAVYGNVSKKIELLAYHLYPFFGRSSKDVTPWNISDSLAQLDNVLYGSMVRLLVGGETISDGSDLLLNELRLHAEVVRGSAFPEQTAEEIVSVQGRHEAWFAARVGIGPSKAQSVLHAIIRNEEKQIRAILPVVHAHAKGLMEEWQNAKRKIPKTRSADEHRILQVFKKRAAAGVFGYVAKLTEFALEFLPIARESIKDLESPLALEEWTSLVNLIGLTIENRKEINDFSKIRQRPLYVLPDRRAILGDISNAMDVLWEKFEEVARQDQGFFQENYQRTKARWLEEKLAAHLGTIFSGSHVYRNLIYPDPDKNNGGTAELDAAVHWGPFLVLVEGKARQFREDAFDPGRLRTDIKRNVEDAYRQAKRAARYVNTLQEVKFTEKDSGRELLVSRDGLRRIYLVTISQHHLAGLATRLATLQQINLFKEAEFPFSISVADLEIISQFCEGPDVFLHYIEKVVQMQKIQGVEFRTDDLDLFGAYLDTRLQASRIWKQSGRRFNFVALSGWSDNFHAWMMYKRGELDKPPEIRLKVPDEIEAILTELRKRGDDAASWIAFALLDMSDSGLNAVAQAVREIRSQQITPGMFRRVALLIDEVVIVVVAARNLPAHLLRERTHLRLAVETYRRKASKGIGFGLMLADSSEPFDCAVWIEGPWQQDERMEELLKSEPLSIPVAGQKLPGRNGPCICGSGKKFKKCCLPKFREGKARQEGEGGMSNFD